MPCVGYTQRVRAYQRTAELTGASIAMNRPPAYSVLVTLLGYGPASMVKYTVLSLYSAPRAVYYFTTQKGGFATARLMI